MKPLIPLKERVGGVKGRLDWLAELGPRAGFYFDRFCERAESLYYWVARLPRKLKTHAQRRPDQELDETMKVGPDAPVRRCPLRRHKITHKILDGCMATLRWLHNHPTARASLVSLLVLGVLVVINDALKLSEGMALAYVVPMWLAIRLGGPLAGVLSVVFTTFAMNHADAARGAIDSGAYGNLTVVRLATLTVILFLMSHIEMRLQRAERMASTDSLTGLMNRSALAEFSEEEIERAKGDKGKVVIAVIDCDRFKLLNDSFGHAFGDMALRTLARKLEAAVGEKGAVARLGGDEFVAVFLGVDEMTVERMLARGAERFQRHMAYFGWERSISYGIASLSDETRDFETILRKADERLYEQKRKSESATSAIVSAEAAKWCLK